MTSPSSLTTGLDARGALVVELAKTAGQQVELGLEPGTYALVLDDNGARSTGEVSVSWTDVRGDCLRRRPRALRPEAARRYPRALLCSCWQLRSC